jgi:hypothetical protein
MLEGQNILEAHFWAWQGGSWQPLKLRDSDREI